MKAKGRAYEIGVSAIEITVVVVVVGLIVAFAAPQIATAMREYRLDSSVRQLNDLMLRAKTRAVAENRSFGFVVDTANLRLGLATLDGAGNAVATDFVPLPQGIRFGRPGDLSAPIANAPTAQDVSFPQQNGATTVFQQNFNSRGFPVVPSAATLHSVYVTNGRSFRALTLNSYGQVRKWWWRNNAWRGATD